jgi:hypothetical protein
MFQRIDVAVHSVGEHVVLAMGSSRWTLHYESALKLSWWMRSCARVAKRRAGDMSRVWRLLGTLHDAEKGPDVGQPYTPNGVYPVNRDVLPLARIGVKQEGTLVLVRLGNEEAKIPHHAAQAIAQWLRLRAKEAKRRACDTQRHWSLIANEESLCH